MPKQVGQSGHSKNRWETLHCWRILSLNTWADSLIQFIPIFMSAEVKEAQTTQLSSDMFDYSVSREPDANYALIQEALNTFEAFCGEKLPVWTFPSLESWNEMGLNLVSVLRVLLWY